jgi:hypothetical protein
MFRQLSKNSNNTQATDNHTPKSPLSSSGSGYQLFGISNGHGFDYYGIPRDISGNIVYVNAATPAPSITPPNSNGMKLGK